MRYCKLAVLCSVLLSVTAAGCASTPPSASGLALRVSVDREEYRIGDPLVAKVRLHNKTSYVVDVPRFDAHSLKFMYGKKDSHARIRREPVYSRAIAPWPRTIRPGGSISRRFVFTRITVEEGEYALLVSFKGAIADKTVLDETVYSVPARFRVSGEIGLKRDKVNGLVLKAQAIDLAKAKAGGEVTFARAVLLGLGKSGLFTWVVMLTEKRPQGRIRKYAVQVDAYTGRVRPLELKGEPSVEAAKKKLQEEPVNESRSASVRPGSKATPRSKGAATGEDKRSPEGGGPE